MNAKTFIFWAGVGIVTLAGSYLVIRWFIRTEEMQAAQQQQKQAEQEAKAPRKEAGFHAIMQEATPIQA